MTLPTDIASPRPLPPTALRPGSLPGMELDELWPRRAWPAVRAELVRRHLPLAHRLAARYRNPNEPMEDLRQVATIGLLGAIDRFDPARGVSFHAFAVPTILGALKRHFRQTGWSAHVPRGTQELALRVTRAAQELGARTGASPRVDAIAAHLGVPVEDVLFGLDAGAAHFATSLDAAASGAGPDEPLTLVDTIGSSDARLEEMDTTLSLAAAIQRLPHIERRALTLRLRRGMKQADIAAQLGCSQMQVSRLLRRAGERLHDLMDPDLSAPPATAGSVNELRRGDRRSA